jgi:transcription elongation GreA/GreB family factor
MNKQKLLQRVIEALTEREKSSKQSLETTRQAAIEAPGAMQSHSDTTKWQMSRLAETIERSLFEIQQALSLLKRLMDYPPTITKGSGYAIVEVKNLDDGSMTKYFLLPAGGGDTYEVDGEGITVLNMGAPMARAFINAVAGDEVEIKIQETTRRFSIVSVT